MNFKKMAKRFFTLSKGHEGFTLVELIVVIAIMAILAGVAVPAYTGYIAKAEKANDLQLLGAINTAFAAAAMENAGGVQNISAAELSYGGTKGATTVTGVRTASGVANVGDLSASFLKYYGTNVSSAFKVITALKYENGVFKDVNDIVNEKYPQGNGMTDTEIQNAANNIHNSNLGGDFDELSGSVNDLSNALADQIGTGLNLKIFFPSEEDFTAFKDKYGLNDDSTDAEIANATILYAASEMKGLTSADIVKITGEDFSKVGDLGDAYGLIPTAALTYGVITGYVNSEYASEEFKDYYTKNPPTGLSDVDTIFGKMVNDGKFQNYMGANEEGDKGIMADIDGYLSAMNVINNYEGSVDLKDPNAFTSEETKALIEQILGAK